MGIQEHGTKIGRRSNGNQVRGNNISGISPNNRNPGIYGRWQDMRRKSGVQRSRAQPINPR
jgi:hypothetical protein